MKIDNYYKQKQIIARVNKNGEIIGKIEKWEAHKKGILHKAFTVCLIYKGKLVLQHRKHPAFDGVFDLTISSHQLFLNNKLEKTTNAAYKTLKREWSLDKKDISYLKFDGAVYYKARDKKSEFIEHEYCEILTAKVKTLPPPNFDFAYGYSLVSKKELLNKNSRIYPLLAPWVIKMIEKGFI